MRVFMAEDNLCAQNLLKLVSHGNAIVAEILRLKDHKPSVYLLNSKELQLKYQDVVLDFSYFKISDTLEKKISNSVKLQDLDDDLKEKYLQLITRFYLLFENIYQYVVDLNSFIEQLHDGAFIQQTIETVMRDVEGKQLICEALYLYGAMLLLCDLYIPGLVRERLLVAFYRYSTSQSQSNVDDVCKLLRDTGYDQQLGKRPLDYPVEYFSRVSIRPDFVEKVVGKLRSEDIYNQLAVYTIPEHQSAALSTQASMLFVCLFFTPHYLIGDTSKMREITDKFFPSNWVVPIYMGVTINIIDYWEHFKAAKSALSNTCNAKVVKDFFGKRGSSVLTLIDKIHQLLKEGTLTNEFVLDNINKIINLLLNSNLVIRWLLLHNSDVIFYDNTKKCKQLRELVAKETNYDPLKMLELLISTAELELRVREVLTHLLENRNESWNKNKEVALDAIKSLSELFSGAKPVTKIQENEQLKIWFDNIAKQVESLNTPITTKSIKKVTQIIQALDEVEEFHGIKGNSTILQFLTESKDALKCVLRAASLKEDYLITLETIADVSYAWCIIDSYTKYMQDSIKDNPAVTSRLRALFLKLASAMEIPLLRINQAHSDDLISVSQYYSNELIKYIQKVLQIIPEMVFSIVEKIIELQTWTIKEVPTRLEKDKLREFAQLENRMEVAKLTHSASTFTTGILDMRSTLVGVIRVDPAELLEEGLLNELDRHISKKFIEFLEPQHKRPQIQSNNLLPRLQKLAESMDGYKRSLEYIQDYINIHGLRIWQKQVTAIIEASVAKEISLRKGVTLYAPSAGFMGNLARQIVHLTDARTCTYISVCTAWFDIKTQLEIVNNKTFAKLNDAIGAVGLHGLDTLYAFMIKNQLQQAQHIIRNSQDKLISGNLDIDAREVEQVILKSVKTIQQLSEVVVLIGTLQILRRHIAYQLNSSCKFESAHLESSLRTFNDSLLRQLKAQTTVEPNVSLDLINNLEEYLLRCGIYEPFQKIYFKSGQELLNADIGRILAIFLIAQLPKLQITQTTGDLTSKKLGDNIDGYPLIIGIYTVLKQTAVPNVDIFVDFLCSYVKKSMILKLKMHETLNEGAYIVRILELFCETFNYSFTKIEDRLPLALLTYTFQK